MRCRLIIVEGPDGSGKTTLAAKLARALQGTIVHHGSYLCVVELHRIYMWSMLAVERQVASVVLDRSWLSESIYGVVMRGGKMRVTQWEIEQLERVAARLDARVVRCLPPLSICLEAFASRPRDEYLWRAEQLEAVWHGYEEMHTSLPVVEYDRAKDDADEIVRHLIGGES